MPKNNKKETVKEDIEVSVKEEQENKEESETESEEEVKPITKPKKVISQRHQEHMVRMRERAIEVKKQRAELTRKANELKNIQKQEKLNEAEISQ